MKLKANDTQILTEGQQLEKAILAKYPSISKSEAVAEFSKLADRSPSSIDRYTRSRSIESKSFKIRAAKLLGYDFADIFLTEKEQIAKYIEVIKANISEYTAAEDIQLFMTLKDICFDGGYTSLLAEIYWCIAMHYKNLSKANIAAEYIKHAIFLYEGFNNPENKLKVISLKSELGLLYLLDGDYKPAIAIFRELLADEEGLKILDAQGMFLIYYRLGICLLDLGEYSQSRKYLEKAFYHTDNNADKGNALKNIGLTYKEQGQYKKAFEYYNEALKYYESTNNRKISIVLNNKAMLFREQGNLEDALKNIELAMEVVEGEKDDGLKYNYLHTHTLIKIDMGEAVEALDTLLKATERASEAILYKKNIHLGIKTLIDYAINNFQIDLIDRIQKMLIQLVRKHKNANDTDLRLKAFLGDILIFKDEHGR